MGWTLTRIVLKRYRTSYLLAKTKIRLPSQQMEQITVLGAFVLTLNWEPAEFFCKSDVGPADYRDLSLTIAT